MKINYSILWLDDKIDSFIEDGWVEKIKSYLLEEGFEPRILTVAKNDVFNKFLKDDSFDLILTDYHMADKNGDEVVKEIRENNIQTEILFYTARGDLKKIENTNRVTFFQTDGDHYSEVVEGTIGLIALTIKKFQHIISMRGMIMHETSTLDSQTAQILRSYFKSGKASNDAIINSICLKLEKLITDKQGFIESIKRNSNYNKLINDTFLFNADHRTDALKNIIEVLGLDDFTDNYKEEVIKYRNKFAHAKLETDESGRQYFKSGDDGITFNEDLCRTLRKDINKHKNNIDELDKALEIFIND